MKKRERRKSKSKKVWLIILIVIIVLVGVISVLFYLNYKKEQNIKLERKNLVEEIASHYAENVEVTKDSNLYQRNGKKYIKIGKIYVGEKLTLKSSNISYKTKYFYIPSLDAYISYKNVKKSDSQKIVDTRYKKYLLFNENIVSKDVVNLYRDDKLVYTFDFSIDKPIIKKDDNGYYVEYLDELFFIKNDDVLKTYENINTNLEEATEVPVTVYHFIYLEGDTSCNEKICHHENQIKEHFQYLKENNFFTMTTNELRLFIEGKIRVPKKSILVTIDDGARAEKFIPFLEEYQVNATLFLISSWYPKEKFASQYMEIASHTHTLHTPGVCPGGQGSPLKCLAKNELVADLKLSRETLDGTEAFCFPFYEFNDYGIEAVKDAGFKIAFIGGMKKANRNTNLYLVPRISLNSSTTLQQYINYIN